MPRIVSIPYAWLGFRSVSIAEREPALLAAAQEGDLVSPQAGARAPAALEVDPPAGRLHRAGCPSAAPR